MAKVTQQMTVLRLAHRTPRFDRNSHMMWFAGCITLPVVLGDPDILEPLLALAENPVG